MRKRPGSAMFEGKECKKDDQRLSPGFQNNQNFLE